MNRSSRGFTALTSFLEHVERVATNSKAVEKDEARKKDLKLLRQIGEWLSPVPFADDFKGFMDKLRPSSCEWIFQKPDYSCWMESNIDANGPPLFWISGMPGAGKSYLATRSIKQLRERHSVAYFYCDSKNDQKRSVLNLLRTWVWQLLQQFSGCLPKIAEIYFEGAPPSVASMREALGIFAKSCEIGCRLVLDGLDECDLVTRSKLFSILPEILGHSRVLIVSRHEIDIGMGISKSGKGFASLKISEADNENDIMGYLQDAVASMDLEDDELEQKILSSLRKGASGMFLWARLMIEDLSVPGRSIEEYETALEKLPEGLDELYGRVLHNLHSNSHRRERSQQLFQWLVCALRPLTINELKAALAVVLDNEHLQPKKVIPKFKETLRLCCGPLIDIDDTAGGTVSLTHASVKDFLLSTPRGSPTFSSLFVESQIAHVYIARACLTYSCFNEIGVVDVNEDLKASLHMLDLHFSAWEFLKYATVNWYNHLYECITFPEPIRSFRRLYSSEYNTVKWLQWMDSLTGDKADFSREDVIRYLLYFRMKTRLLRDDTMYEQWLTHLEGPRTRRVSRLTLALREGFLRCTPILHTCAAFDFDTLAEKIIGERGSVDGFVDLRSHTGGTALHYAASLNAVEVTKILLRAGARIDARCNGGNTPRMHAVTWNGPPYVRSGTFEVASLLIKSGADVSLHCQRRETALTHACRIPLPEDDHLLSLVTSLLEHGATKTMNQGREVVPIGSAAWNNTIRLVRTLIRYGADVDAVPSSDCNGGKLSTALVHVCARKDCLAIPILIEAGADVHARDQNGLTCLHKTARVNSYNASKLLLELGSDVNAVACFDGSMPFHEAVRENHIAQMDLLVKNNTKLEIEDASSRTPLDIAFDNNSSEAISLLLKAGANPHRKDRVVESNDQGLKVTKCSQKHQPETPHDLFHVFWMLTKGLESRLPRSVSAKVISLADYRLKSDDSRSDYECVTEEVTGAVYVKSRPIQGLIQKIVFTFVSHDQGGSDYPAQHGTYNDSSSWFEVEIFDAQGLPVAVHEHEKRIQANVHASRVRRKHILVYGFGLHMRQARWLEQLKQGYIVGVAPHARYRGWENHVYTVRIEIYYTCLLDWS